MNQFGDVSAGPGAARDNIVPHNISKINKGTKSRKKEIDFFIDSVLFLLF